MEKLSQNPGHILIVDDEEAICKALSDVFEDEGYSTQCFNSGEEALNYVEKEDPSVVLLDIWMPGIDGMETLERLKSFKPDLPVIMISGHASIPTAIQATKVGAEDLIQKPLDLDSTLSVVSRVLEQQTEISPSEPSKIPTGVDVHLSNLDRIVFKDFFLAGELVPQKTFAKSAVLYGHGVHSGEKSGLLLEPLPAGSGIHFTGIEHEDTVPAHVSYVEGVGFATTLKRGKAQAATVEHLMSALCAYGITNLLIKCNGEVPVLDGSSLEFCKLIEETGVLEQEGDFRTIEVKEAFRVGNEEEYVVFEPASSSLTIDYTLSYPEPLGTQRMTFELNEPSTYKQEIAPARTFGFVDQIGYLQKNGLGLGGRFDNFVLFGEEGPLNGELRFENEPVRHKILDMIGDLYLLGRPLRGKITAKMTGHSDNVEVLKHILTNVKELEGNE